MPGRQVTAARAVSRCQQGVNARTFAQLTAEGWTFIELYLPIAVRSVCSWSAFGPTPAD
jgi:hypothetical protein